MKQDTKASESSRIVKKRIIAYVLDIEDMKMHIIVNTGVKSDNTIDLPVLQSPGSSCHVVAGGGDVAVIRVYPDRGIVVRIISDDR